MSFYFLGVNSNGLVTEYKMAEGFLATNLQKGTVAKNIYDESIVFWNLSSFKDKNGDNALLINNILTPITEEERIECLSQLFNTFFVNIELLSFSYFTHQSNVSPCAIFKLIIKEFFKNNEIDFEIKKEPINGVVMYNILSSYNDIIAQLNMAPLTISMSKDIFVLRSVLNAAMTLIWDDLGLSVKDYSNFLSQEDNEALILDKETAHFNLTQKWPIEYLSEESMQNLLKR